MHDDVIADRVDIFDPLPLRPLELRKSPEILQRQRSMACQRVQQVLFTRGRRALPSNQAQTAQTLFVARGDRNKGHIRDLSVFILCPARSQWWTKRNRQSLSLGARLASEANQRNLLCRQQIVPVGIRLRLIQIRLAPAKHQDAAPPRVQHPRRSLRKPLKNAGRFRECAASTTNSMSSSAA